MGEVVEIVMSGETRLQKNLLQLSMFLSLYDRARLAAGPDL